MLIKYINILIFYVCINVQALAFISSDFSIIGDNDLVSVDLGSLDNIGGDMMISSQRDVLASLALAHDYTIGGSIDLPNCHRYIGDVTVGAAASDYTFAREIIVGDVWLEQDFSGDFDAKDHLPNLQAIEGSLTIAGTSASSVSFPDLESVSSGSILISGAVKSYKNIKN